MNFFCDIFALYKQISPGITMYSHTENQQCADVAYCQVLFLDLKCELTRPVIMGQLCDINTLTPTIAKRVLLLSIRVPGCQKLQMTA